MLQNDYGNIMTSELSPEQERDLDLLKKHEPILQFAAKEDFYPMNAGDYLSRCHLPNNQRKKKENEGDGKQPYYHFIHENSLSTGSQVLTFILFACLLYVIWYSVQPRQFGLLKSLNPDWPDFWNKPFDDIRMVVFAAIVLTWPIFRGNRRVHFALIMDVALIVFLGSPIGVGIGLVATIMIPILALLVGIQRWAIRKKWFGKTRFIILLVVIMLPIAILFTVGLVLFLEEVLQFNRSLIIITYDRTIFLEFYELIILLLLWSVGATLLWTTAGYLLSQLFNKLRTRPDEKWIGKMMNFLEDKISLEEELRPTIVLLLSILVLFVLYATFADWGMLRPGGHGRAIAFSLLATTAASVGFWFFEDPLNFLQTIREVSTLKAETEEQEMAKEQKKKEEEEKGVALPLSWRVFGITFTGFIAYLALSIYWIVIRLPWIQFELTPTVIIAFPIGFVIAVFLIIFITIGLLGPSAASFIMDLTSFQPDAVAKRAKRKYDKIVTKDEGRYWYHGRVLTDGNWTALQYHYFYAYNNWRSAIGGLNNHEGDWEAVAVFLKRKPDSPADEDPEPFGVAYSQHHHGKFRFWQDAERDETKMHPCVYVAWGSHANYSKADIYETSMLVSGVTRRIMNIVGSLIRRFRGKQSGLPIEDARGDGKKVCEWNRQLITDETPYWVKYEGLWGNKTRHKDESGPTGPRWKRPTDEGYSRDKERPRWKLHDWKDILLLELSHSSDESITVRRKALQSLVRESKKEVG